MILETVFVLCIVGIILVFFYKQAVEEFRILQTDSFEKAMGLLGERSPTVVLPIPILHGLWTHQDCKQRPTLLGMPLQGRLLSDRIKEDSVPLHWEMSEKLAEEVGLNVWVRETILPIYKQSFWWTGMLQTRTEALIGAQGIRQTYGYSTILLCTDGAISVSLMNESSNAYLPKQWRGKRISKMTRDDAPLLGQIQYVDVIVRPGSALIIPPHWKVCWENLDTKAPTSLSVWIEVHHPLSKIVWKSAMRSEPPPQISYTQPQTQQQYIQQQPQQQYQQYTQQQPTVYVKG